uniref:Putative secreted protein n=1 Tax=Anopheles triannulatus TaxID=58253 RepID=A0A2M4B6G0_9DIPT
MLLRFLLITYSRSVSQSQAMALGTMSPLSASPFSTTDECFPSSVFIRSYVSRRDTIVFPGLYRRSDDSAFTVVSISILLMLAS